ncbi:hypothetical protein RINTHM_12890 [Richelia intracellularis HM01]|nr:hypothetical protein RINTHM_12890 [Richelia intracellularis HM01]
MDFVTAKIDGILINNQKLRKFINSKQQEIFIIINLPYIG